MDAAILQIRLLGDFSLVLGDEPVIGVNSARLQSLLAYLVLHRDAPQSRQHLAFLFWPDLTEAQARNNLRQALYQLRHALPNNDRYFYADASTLGWRPDSPYSLDLINFKDALDAAGIAEDAGNPTALYRALEQAVHLYRGELLPSCYDDWIVPERERLHEQCLQALERMIYLLEGQRAYTVAIPFAQRLLRHDPLHENGYRLLMRLHALNNDRASALRTYHTCADVFRRELGVEPEPDTQAMYQRLLGARAPLSTPAQSSELVSVPPLVGRDDVWAQLQAIWQRAAASGPHFVLISGEAGVGKSRLAEELLDWAARQGISTAKTRAFAAEGRLSYGPLTDWLRSEACRTVLSRLDRVWLTEISRLLPELLVESPDLPGPEPLTEPWQRQRFFQALTRAVLAMRQPLLLLMDDLQWCDPETLEWLHYLLRADPQAKMLVLGIVRSEEIMINRSLQGFFLDLHRAAQVMEIDLNPIDAAETARLASYIIGHELEVSTALRLFDETEGNPLFILETLRSGSLAGERRHDVFEPDGDPVPADAVTAAWLPPKVQAVISARLAQLSTPARELAGLAATIGRSFTWDVLTQASNAGEDDLIRSLDELWQRRIVRVLDAQTYDFTHDKLREVAYTEVSLPHRHLLHRRVARALESVYASDLDPISGQLATHFEHARNPERAIPYYYRAAVVTQRMGAYQEAIRLLKKALGLLQALPLNPGRDECELELQTTLGALLAHSQGHGAPEVIQAYERAQALCQQLGRPLSPPILRALAIANIPQAKFRKALGFGEQLLTLSENETSDFLRTESHYTLGVAHFWLGAFVLSRRHLEKAVACYNPQQSQRHTFLYTQDPKVISLCRLAFDLWCLGYPVQAMEAGQQALDYAKELKHFFSLAYAISWYAMLQNHLRAFEIGRSYAEELIALSRDQHLAYWPLEGIPILGWAQSELGEIEAGVQSLRQGIEDQQSLGYQFKIPFYLSLLGEQVGRSGDISQGLAFLDEAQAMVEKNEERWCEAELDRRRGELLLRKSDAPGAEIAFRCALAVAHSQEARMMELRAAIQLARLWQGQGKVFEAKQLLAPLYGWFREGFDIPDLQDARELLENA